MIGKILIVRNISNKIIVMEKHGLYLENSMDNRRKFMVEHIELSDIPEFCLEKNG